MLTWGRKSLVKKISQPQAVWTRFISRVKSRFGESDEVITALNGSTIILGGVGDTPLIDAIARTLRPVSG